MDEQTEQKSNSSAKVGVAIIGIIALAFIGIVAYQSQAKTQVQNATTPAVTTEAKANPTTAEEAAPTTAETSTYKDGTYTAVGNYVSPGGQEELGVSLTIADGVVTDSSVEVLATRPTSVERQTDFAANYKNMVVGKSIDELQLTKVSGSSLSPKGFNDAVEKIKSEAQS